MKLDYQANKWQNNSKCEFPGENVKVIALSRMFTTCMEFQLIKYCNVPSLKVRSCSEKNVK